MSAHTIHMLGNHHKKKKKIYTAYEDGTDRMFQNKIQTLGNHPKDRIKHVFIYLKL